jgi:putative spermidine/putrescine transport system substrate-binding protein
MTSRMTALVVFVGLLVGFSACGGSSGSSSSAPSVSASQVADAKGSLAVAGWQYYEVPDVQDAGPVTTKWTYLSSAPDTITKARSGQFDLVSTASDSISSIAALNVLVPIDTEVITNYEDILAPLREDPEWKNPDGETVAVPFSVTAALTAYDTSKVPEAKTLNDLLSPAYADGIAVYDDPATIGSIAVAQGAKDTREMTQDELDRAMNFLDRMKPNVKTFFRSGEETQLFNSGAIDVCLGTFGTVLAPAVENNPSIKFNFLAEGSFVNLWSIDREADVPAALNWINRTLTRNGQSAIVGASGDYPAVPAATSALRQLGDPVSDAMSKLTLDHVLKEAPIFRGFSAEAHGDVVAIDDVTRAWSQYKASF